MKIDQLSTQTNSTQLDGWVKPKLTLTKMTYHYLRNVAPLKIQKFLLFKNEKNKMIYLWTPILVDHLR